VAALLAEAAAGALRTAPAFRPEAAVTVVCASEGYPAAPAPVTSSRGSTPPAPSPA